MSNSPSTYRLSGNLGNLPSWCIRGVGGRLVMLVSLGGRLFELMLIGLSRFGYLLDVFGLDKLQVKQVLRVCPYKSAQVKVWRFVLLIVEVLEEAIYLLEDRNISKIRGFVEADLQDKKKISYLHQKLIVTAPWKEAQSPPSGTIVSGSRKPVKTTMRGCLSRGARTAKASLADNRTANW
nr:hypothetical protein [Tanacetum cinerariifolium]